MKPTTETGGTSERVSKLVRIAIAENEPTVYVGIDPGSLGGIVVLQGDKVYSLQTTPKTDEKLLSAIHSIPYPAKVAIEQVSGYAGTGRPGSRMFAFGRNYGKLEMGCVACGFTPVYVTPAKWQKKVGMRARRSGESDTSWKNALKDRAKYLYPDVKVTLRTADALLIATYLMREMEW